jgi:hypothetical protein
LEDLVSGRVYVLGAGFSLAISSGLPDESRMPDTRGLSDAVMARFNQQLPGDIYANAIDESHYSGSADLRENIEYLRRTGKLEALLSSLRDSLLLHSISGFGTPLVNNFEQWLSFLIDSPPWLPPAELARNRATFLHIAEAIATILSSRQEMTVSEHNGNCPNWLSNLVDLWGRENAKVITFNYDQLVELAWLSGGREGEPRARSWDLYPAPLTPLIARTGTTPPASSVSGAFEFFSNSMALLVGGMQVQMALLATSCTTRG